MKRAHYAAGAAVLTPVAMAMAVPAAAQAAAAAPGAPQGKTVSMHPLRATLRPDNGCTGVSPFNIGASPNVHARGHGWRTRHNPGSVCVGTVDASLFFTKNICKSISVSTRELGIVVAVETTTFCGTTGHWTESPFGFHSLFQGAAAVDVSVCIKSQFDGGKVNCAGV